MDANLSKDNDTQPKLSDIIPRPIDRKVVVILCLTPVLLTINFYLREFRQWSVVLTSILDFLGTENAGRAINQYFRNPSHGELRRLYVWIGLLTVTYLIVPALVIKLIFRERLSDYGLKLTGWYRDRKSVV